MLSINEISLEDFQAMQTEEEKIKFYDLICEKSNRIKKLNYAFGNVVAESHLRAEQVLVRQSWHAF